MCLKHYSFRAELSYMSCNKLLDRELDGIYGVWESKAALFSFSLLNAQGLEPGPSDRFA